jgi:hypothetical protein
MAAVAAAVAAAVMRQRRPQGGSLRGPPTPVSTAGRILLQVRFGVGFVLAIYDPRDTVAEVFGT